MLKEALVNFAHYSSFSSFFGRQPSSHSNSIHRQQQIDPCMLLASADSTRSINTPPPPYEKIENDIDLSHNTKEEGCNDNLLDDKLIKQSVTLLQLAPDVPRNMALDLYMVGLERMIAALPLDTDPQAKAILRKKLQDITSRYQLETSPGGSNDSKDYSDLVVRAAVALKASPIPDFMHWVLSSMLQGICHLDKKLCIRQHVWTMASKSITKMIDLDNQYHLHHAATRLVYTGFTTICKACVAYTEAPSYNEIKKHA